MAESTNPSRKVETKSNFYPTFTLHVYSVNFSAKICITVQIDLLGLQTSDLLRIVRKIPAIFSIMFMSRSERFHLGDVSVLKDRKSMQRPGLSTNELLNNYPEFSQLMKHCCEIAFTHFFFIITKTNFLYLPLDQKITT